MASKVSPDKVVASSSSPELPSLQRSSSRSKQQKAKHNVRPDYKFITATDPAQFKEPEAQKCVRSKAMESVKKSQARDRERQNASTGKVTPVPQPLLPIRRAPVHESRKDTISFQAIRTERRYPDEKVGNQMWANDMAIRHAIENKTEPPHPQCQGLSLNAEYLQKSCLEAFSPDTSRIGMSTFSESWMSLSSAMLASAWEDMQTGKSTDSERTIIANDEVIAMLNERISSEARLDDPTLIVILHLLASEMWTCNKERLRLHISGIIDFINHRGGMEHLDRVVAEVAAACCFHCHIFCETSLSPVFQSWHQVGAASIGESSWFHESPLFSSANGFKKLSQDPQCSNNTYELLGDMRDLTNMVLASDMSFKPPEEFFEICRRTESLPSADTQGLLTSNDWIYEACRIAALIYIQAIAMREPFSRAAEVAFHKARDMNLSNPRLHSLAAHPATALYNVLQRTDTDTIWGNMSGVLYWVTAVGAAAASRHHSGDYTVDEDSKRGPLIMHSVRTMFMLLFEHPVPILTAQRRLLQVQEKLDLDVCGQRSESLQPAATRS